jgi:hypothetical protein
VNLDLRNRPIAATRHQAGLWVDRPDDLGVLRRAIDMGFNALVLSDPGGGLTSLLNRFAAELEDAGRRTIRRSARRAEDARTLLEDLADALEQESSRALRKPAAEEPLDMAFERFRRAAEADGGRTILVLDDVPGALGHALFGRLRDELWSIDAQWVVGGRTADEALFLTPPADAFFETVHYLRPMSSDQLLRLLQRRDPAGQLSGSLRRAIVEKGRGNPAVALRLAREAVASNDPEAAVGRGTVVDAVASQLGQPAARLADELARGGPTGPSDTGLLQRLGWSRPRAYQVFQQLEEAGFVTASEDRDGRPGRPRKVYRLAGVI